MKKKHFLIIALLFTLLSMVGVGCSTWKSPDDYSEEEIVKIGHDEGYDIGIEFGTHMYEGDSYDRMLAAAKRTYFGEIITSEDNRVFKRFSEAFFTGMQEGIREKCGSDNSGSNSSVSGDKGSCGSHDYVDLGLPSGTLWATSNVGASSPEDYGDCFAWGETSPKSSYDLSDYKWCRGVPDTITKYCVDGDYGKVDDKEELDLVDDAAHVNWGAGWRMPSHEQQEELRENCKWTWTKRNGVNGYEVSRNGKSIFLPAAGQRTIDPSLNQEGSNGVYWSRTLYSRKSSSAYILEFSSSYVDYHYHDGRHCGHSVRAVRVVRN